MNIFKIVNVLICLLLVSSSVLAQIPDSIEAHIDSCLNVLKQHSLYKGSVNWDSLTAVVKNDAAGVTQKEATFKALCIAFQTLDDKHAAYYQYDDFFRSDNSVLTSRYSDSLKTAWSKGLKLYGIMLDSVAYVNIPYLKANNKEVIDKYANDIYTIIQNLHKSQPKAWIIDLRLNGGGNIRPMLAGLASFFPDGPLAFYIDPNGDITGQMIIKNGRFVMDDEEPPAVNSNIPELKFAKVAVLIGPGTASSGEGVAAAFQQREYTTLFGEASAGLANATDGFIFNNNNNYFLLSVASLVDKNAQILPEIILPDVIFSGNQSFHFPENDTLVQEAIRILFQLNNKLNPDFQEK